MSASPNHTPSPHPVLPPIIKNEKDRRFLQELNSFIKQEMATINSMDCHQRYVVHRAAFDRIIDYVQSYKPLLNAIKAEYEDFIETIKRGRREADFLSDKLQTMAAEPSTLRNYKKRREDLQKKIDIIQQDNSRLMKQLQDLRDQRIKKESALKSEETIVVKQEPKKDPRRIPGLTLEQATNPDVLVAEFQNLDAQLNELNSTWNVRYRPKSKKEQLKELLSEKVEQKDELAEQGETLKERRQRLRVALEVANQYKKAPPFNKTIGDAVADSFKQTGMHKVADGHTEAESKDVQIGSTFEDDDPTKEREADMMLEYIAKFNELFDEKKYEEAAIHAANSPKGILRNMETLSRFKNVVDGKGRSPLLAFCDALMSSVLALGVKPSEVMSMECVKCALKENRLDLLSHWISQQRLTVTETLGDLIVEYCNKHKNRTYLSLAESIYLQVNARMKTIRVLIQQGRVKRALEFTLQEGATLTQDVWLSLLKEFPSPQLAQALTDKHPQLGDTRLLPIGVVVCKLLDIDQFSLGLNLLQHLYIQGPQQGFKNEPSLLRRAVFEDEVTTLNQWHDIVKQCQDTGYEEVALELLAAITVLRVIRQTGTENTIDSLDSDGSCPSVMADTVDDVGGVSDTSPPNTTESGAGETSDMSPPNTTESERQFLNAMDEDSEGGDEED